MLKVLAKSLIIAALGFTAVGCVSVSPLQVTSNNGPTKKVGESGCVQIFYLSKIGDCSYDTAKKNASITNVHHTDQKVTDYVIFTVIKTEVYGD